MTDVADDGTRSLRSIGLFASLGEDDLARLSDSCRWRRYRRGDRIIEQGSESREVFFVVDGAVSIVNQGPSGREVAFATFRAGEHFGELAAIDGMPRSAGAIALSDSLLALLPSERFLRLLEDRGQVSLALLRELTVMVRTGDSRIMELSTLAAAQRVYAELLRMAVPDAAVPGQWVIRPLPPLREIASHVSTTRETVARAMSSLYPSGLIKRKGRNLYIMDRQRFEELVGSGSQ